jgi:hypothetical protein
MIKTTKPQLLSQGRQPGTLEAFPVPMLNLNYQILLFLIFSSGSQKDHQSPDNARLSFILLNGNRLHMINLTPQTRSTSYVRAGQVS